MEQCNEGVILLPQDMTELQSVERNSEMGRKACLEMNLHSFLHKWVSELTGRECQGTPLSTSDGKLATPLSQKTFFFSASVSFLFFRSE